MREILITLGTAMVPVLELRAAIPLGVRLGLSPLMSLLVSVVGNMIPVPFIILLIRRVFALLRRVPWFEKLVIRIEERAHIKGELVQKSRVPGLILLVAVPLPGTGAWTGALVAALLEIRMRNALPAILLGVLIAGGIVLALTCGVTALL